MSSIHFISMDNSMDVSDLSSLANFLEREEQSAKAICIENIVNINTNNKELFIMLTVIA